MLNIVISSEQSLFEELWEYFVDKYFTIDMPYLENISMDTGSLVTIPSIIIGLILGIVIAAGCSIFNKRYIGGFVRHIIYNECFDASSAKTLYDLGYLKSPAIRSVIKSSGSLSRWVRCVEEDHFIEEIAKKREEFEELHKNDAKKPKFKEPPFKRDLNTMHFYIPKERKYAAEIKFDDKGAHLGTFIIIVVLAIILCAFLFFIMPDILKMIDNFISIMKNN